MIDMLVLRCSFTDQVNLSVKDLSIPLEASIDPVNGEVYSHRHNWESIPSSNDSLAFKVFDYYLKEDRHFYIEIKASPAKLMQGHNVFGSDDINACSMSLINTLLDQYPDLFSLLNMDTWTVEQVDVTYHSFADTESNALRFVNALSNVSNGQTKSRTGYDGTVYFGKKNSRIRKIKVYCKNKEVLHRIDEMKRKGDPKGLLKYHNHDLVTYTQGMIRWEVTLKARWFERNNINNKLQNFIKEFNPKEAWMKAISPIFDALDGEVMKIINDEKVKILLRNSLQKTTKTGKTSYTLADSVYRTYRTIKAEGFVEAKSIMPVRTFQLHINHILSSVGYSKAQLQSMTGQGLMGEVIPFTRFISVDFSSQFPEWHKAA